MTSSTLIGELMQVRQDIRSQLRKSNTRDSSVCSDEFIYLMAQQQPQNVAQMRGLPGVTALFLNNYAQAFINVIASNNAQRMLEFSPDIDAELMSARERLLNISTTNPMLYISGCSPRTLTDMTNILQRNSLIPFLTGGTKELTLCDCTSPTARAEQIRIYKYYSVLSREAERMRTKYGKNILYIGFPMASGYLPNGTPFRAPLVYFPVSVELSSYSITITHDTARNVVFNSAIAAALGESYASARLPRTGTASLPSLMKAITEHYRGIGVSLQGQENNLTPLSHIPFPEKTEGELKIFCTPIYGLFPAYDTAVFNDCFHIEKSGHITPLLNELLDPLPDISVSNKSGTGNTPETICALASDHKQRICASAAGTQDVILSGAPDTGVLQTIANAILKVAEESPQTRIAIITETPSIIDKLCERMGEAGQYIVPLFDASDISACADKILAVADRRIPILDPGDNDPDIRTAGNSLKEQWDMIMRHTYHEMAHGVRTIDLYAKGIEWDSYSPEIVINSAQILKNITSSLTRISLPLLIRTANKFQDPSVAALAGRIWSLRRTVPMLPYIRKTLRQDAVQELAKLSVEAVDAMHKYQHKSKAYKKVFSDPSVTKAKSIAERYFEKEHLNKWQSILQTPSNSLPLLYKKYVRYHSLIKRIQHMTPLEWEYYSGLERIMELGLAVSPVQANTVLKRTLLYSFITEQEKTIPAQIWDQDINSLYEKLLDNLDLQQKQVMSKVLYALERRRVLHVTSEKGKEDVALLTCIAERKSTASLPVKSLLSGFGIWAMTPDAMSAIMPLESGLFDLVVFISADHLRYDRAIPSIYRARHVLIAGDAQNKSSVSSEDGAASLLEIAKGKLPEIKLDCYYGSERSNVMRYASERFYEPMNIIDNARVPIGSGVDLVYVPDAEWANNCNEKEAIAVANAVVEHLKKDPDCDLAILSFSTRQKDRIALLLGERSEKDAELHHILLTRKRKLFVSTVNDANYESHDTVIVSVGITPAMTMAITPEAVWPSFYSDTAICTACTRAQKELRIFTSVTPADIAAMATPGGPLYRLRDFLLFAEQPLRTKDVTYTYPVIESIRTEIAEELAKYGFTCEYNVGTGDYYVDIAFTKNGRYLLGLIVDYIPSAENLPMPHNVLDRIQYLRARGWKPHLLQLHNWWTDRSLVTKQILSNLLS